MTIFATAKIALAAQFNELFLNLLNHRSAFRLGIKLVDLFAIAVFDHAAAQFHRRSKCAIFGGEFVGDEQDAFQFFEAGEIPVYLFYNPFIERLNFSAGD